MFEEMEETDFFDAGSLILLDGDVPGFRIELPADRTSVETQGRYEAGGLVVFKDELLR